MIAIDKPAGMTSHDVISAVRRVTGEGRVGHAGTLDPFATGVLVVCIGPATRLADLAMAHDKEYEARISFGTQTDTDDLTGEPVESVEPADCVLDETYAQDALRRFTGTILQVPPQYSAKKIGGRKAYEIARGGEVADVAPVEVTVSRAELLGLGMAASEVGGAECPYWDVRLEVSKGTYIRALARDIGIACGTRAHLASLRRTRSGSVDASQCLRLDMLERQYAPGLLDVVALDPAEVLGYPVLEARGREMERVANGSPFDDRWDLERGTRASVTSEGRLRAVYESDGRGSLRCKIMIPGGVAGVRSRADER